MTFSNVRGYNNLYSPIKKLMLPDLSEHMLQGFSVDLEPSFQVSTQQKKEKKKSERG